MSHAHDSHDHQGFEVQVERTGPCLAQVKLEVTAAELDRTRSRGLQNLARQVRMKGFRPGKVPRQILERQFGEQVDRDVLEHFVQHAYQDAVKKHELRPAAQPRIDMDTARPEAGKDFSLSFEILLRPDVALGDVTGLTVEGQSVAVTDEELEGTIQDLRRQNARPEPAEDDGLPEDGMAVCDISFEQTGVEEPVLAREGMRLNSKTIPGGVDPEAYATAMTGAKAGEVLELATTFPEDFPVEGARGQTGTLKIKIKEAFRVVLPEIEDLFGMVEAEDEAGFREIVRTKIQEHKEQSENARIEAELLEQILEHHELELPEPLIEDQVRQRMTELRETLGKEGLSEADIETRIAEEEPQAFEGSKKALRAIYLMEEIAKKHELLVTEQDFEGEMASIAERNDAPIDEVRKYYQEEGLVRQLGLELLERKVRSFLRESADIQVTKGPA